VVSLLSSVMTVVRLPISCTSSMAYWLHDPLLLFIIIIIKLHLEPDEVNSWCSVSFTRHRCRTSALCSRLQVDRRPIYFRCNCMSIQQAHCDVT